MGARRSDHTPITRLFLDPNWPTVGSRARRSYELKRARLAHSSRTRLRVRDFFFYLAHVNVFGKSIALTLDGFRKNDWTKGPVTVHLLDLGMPEACVYTLVLERRGACAVQTCCPGNACSDPKLRALCFHVCVKTDGAESRVLPRTYNDIGAESRSCPSPCRLGLSWLDPFWFRP